MGESGSNGMNGGANGNGMNGGHNPDRRGFERFEAALDVDYRSGETFLFSSIENISEMGIFIRSDNPLPVGTVLDLRFQHEGLDFEVTGEVTWINPYRPGGDNLNPGMGVRFTDLTPELREQLVSLVRTIAYLQNDGSN